MNHDSDDLIGVFNALFMHSHDTILVRGGSEPLYQPAGSAGSPARIEFAYGYFSSALHEIAHWCLAGERRRQLVDYGYWYHGDGRSAELQAEFERVEVKPQALEWVFSMAAGCRFRVSLDNLDGAPHDEDLFKANLVQQARDFLKGELPERARIFMRALQEKYSRDISPEYFCLERLN